MTLTHGQIMNGKSVQRILVADDDSKFLDSLTSALSGEVKEVCAARNSEEVLDILYNGNFDLLMLGIGLRPQSSIEVAEWAKLTYPELPVIFMAEPSYLEVDGRLKRVTSYPVLSKPFGPEDLEEILRRKPSDN